MLEFKFVDDMGNLIDPADHPEWVQVWLYQDNHSFDQMIAELLF